MDAAIKQTMRQAIALSIYRGLIGFIFLVVAFGAFRESVGAIAFGFLVFSTWLATVVHVIQVTALENRRIDDLAERKTRHTIVLAHNPDWRDDLGFWDEVNRRVALESDLPEKTSGWAYAGLLIGGIAWRAACDLVFIMVAMVFAGAS